MSQAPASQRLIAAKTIQEVSFDLRQLLVSTASSETMVNKHVLIIGGGIAGLAAGCYARMSGFQATV